MRLAEHHNRLLMSALSMGRRRVILYLLTNLGLGAMHHGSGSSCSFEIAWKVQTFPFLITTILIPLILKSGFLLVASYNPVQDQTLKNEVFEKKNWFRVS